MTTKLCTFLVQLLVNIHILEPRHIHGTCSKIKTPDELFLRNNMWTGFAPH